MSGEHSITFRLLPEESSESQSVYYTRELGDFITRVYTTGTQATLSMELYDPPGDDTICLDGICATLRHPPREPEIQVPVETIKILTAFQRAAYLRLLHAAMWEDLVQITDELIRNNPMKSGMHRTHELIGLVGTCDQLISHLPEVEQ